MMSLKPVIVLPLVAAFTLSACDTVGRREGAGLATGAALGAGLGALIPGNRGATAVVGAAAGAIIGGAIGAELDRQAGELRGNLGNSDIQVINTGTELRVVMPQGILFATDSAELSPAIMGDLNILAAHLVKYADSTVQVVGHTDNTGEASYNLSLSRKRAQSVSAVLQGRGVAFSRLQAIGKGDSEPVASNLSPEGRQQNRRVEVIIIPTA